MFKAPCITPDAVRMFQDLVNGARCITVAAHAHPDGDALGSVSALAWWLRERLGKDAVAIFPDTPPDTIRFIVPEGVPCLCGDREPDACGARIAASDLVILLDCRSFGRTETLKDLFPASPARKVLVDHHLDPDCGAFDLVFSTPDISSASELLYQVLREIEGSAKGLPAVTLRCLMTGMTTDTNNFANSVFPSTMEMASELLAAGVDRDAILTDLYNRYRENRVRLMGCLQYEHLHITPEGLAYMIATREILDRFDAREGETEGLVNVPLAIAEVKMSILLKEDDGHFRVSVRSKKGWSAQQCAIRWFNGGGHENASGGKLFWPKDIASPDEAAAYLENVSRQCLG